LNGRFVAAFSNCERPVLPVSARRPRDITPIKVKTPAPSVCHRQVSDEDAEAD